MSRKRNSKTSSNSASGGILPIKPGLVLKEQGRYFDETKAKRAEMFPPAYLTIFEGNNSGEAMELTPVWRDFWRRLFGWRDAEDGTRWYSTAYIFIPRKNAKSMTIAALALAYPMIEPEQGGQIWIGASTEDQAKIIFDFMRRFIEGSPELQLIYRVAAEEIEHVKTGTRIRFISAAGKIGKTGKGPSVLIIDELQDQKDNTLLNVMRTGRVARRSPLTILIGTAGKQDISQKDVPWIAELTRAEKILANPELNLRYLPIIYRAGEDDDPGDPKTWMKANPGIGYNISLKDFKQLWLDMKDTPKDRAEFLQYNLNIVQSLASEYLDMKKWATLKSNFDLKSLRGQLCYGGLDLGHSSDMTALSLLFVKWSPVKYKDDEGRWQTKMHPTFKLLVFYWSNKDAIKLTEKEDIDHATWVKEKWLRESGEVVQDYELIRKDISKIKRMVKLEGIGYDPWHADEITKNLAKKDKIAMTAVRQFPRVLGVPTKRFKEIVKNADIEHNGNPILTENLRNVRVISDTNKTETLSKKHSKGKIDGLSATMNAMKLFIDAPPPRAPLRVTSI